MTRLLKSALAAAGLLVAASVAQISGAWAQPIYHPPAGQDLQGVWLIEGDHGAIKTEDGKLPPLLPEAAKTYKAHLAARKAGKPEFDTITKCWPHGLPRILFAAYPIEVLQEPKQVTFIHEVHHMPRLVFLDAKLPALDDLDQNWMGFSAGRWDGDTLVVESQGFNDKTTLDAAGLPHSVQMKLDERIKKLDADTLQDVITVTDPKTYKAPWTTRVTFKRQPGLRLKEYVCTDANPEAGK